MIATEHVLELGSDHGIQAIHIVGTDTLAIGRVSDHHTVGRSVSPLRQRLHLQIYVFCHTGALGVFGSYGDSFRRYVGSDYRMLDGTFG